jgi:hypothetical protein
MVHFSYEAKPEPLHLPNQFFCFKVLIVGVVQEYANICCFGCGCQETQVEVF